MKKFQYSLQRVLDVRDAVVSRRKTQLAEAERELMTLQHELCRCEDVVRVTADSLQASQGCAPITGVECTRQRAWFHHLADRLRFVVEAERTQQGEVRNRREVLKKAMMDRKVMESMARRERQHWAHQWRDAERKEMDEVAASVFLRGTDDPAGSKRRRK